MGLYDRDYARYALASRSQPVDLRLLTVNTWIIIICCIVFLLDQVSSKGFFETPGGVMQMSWIEAWGHFSAGTAIGNLQLWRFVTFQFLHANFTHILFNMFSLVVFGPLIENYLGRWRYLAFYLICGVFGGVSYLVLWRLNVLVSSPWVPLVGASAGIFGVLIAAARVAPNARVLVMGAIPMTLRNMAWLLIAIAIYSVFSSGPNAGGEAAHLGGAGMGYVLITFPRLLSIFPRSRRG